MEYRVPGSGRLPGYTLGLAELSKTARVFATKPGLTQLRVNEPRASSTDEAQVLCPVESYRGALPGRILVRIAITGRHAPMRSRCKSDSMPIERRRKSVIVATPRNTDSGEFVAPNSFR